MMTWFGHNFPLFPCSNHIPISAFSTSFNTGSNDFDSLLNEFSDIFSSNKKDLPPCTLTQCKINTGSSPPIRQRAYRTPLAKREIVNREIDTMLRDKIIRPSSSPYASPITLVPKKDGTTRFCVDYRKLNQATIKDSHPLPLIQDIFDQLSGAKYFSTLDLKSGYWQIPVAKRDIKKTAFICHSGLYEFLRMPFGLANAPAIFQRTMERVLHGLIGKTCLVYLDDLVVFGTTPEDHLANLRLVFERLRKFNLTVKPSKCSFNKTEILLLGYVIDKNGIRSNPAKVAAIRDLPPPTKVSEVRTFLGMSGYYRNLVQNYAGIAQPLINLTKKNTKFIWSEECAKAFQKLKDILLSDVILTYPNTQKPYRLYTDASNYAIGSILVQLDDEGNEKVIQYLSHALDTTQQKWPVIEKEAYAIVYSLQKLRPYLWGADFQIFTDHKPLKALFSQQIVNSKIQRWAVQISEFGAPIHYTDGKDNARADMLSRAVYHKSVPIDTNTVEWSLPLAFDGIDRDELISAQQAEFPSLINRAHEADGYSFDNGVLLSHSRPGYEHACYPRIVLPRKWRQDVVEHRHVQIGHAAARRTLFHVQEAYVWSGMCKDIKEILEKCSSCQVFHQRKPHVHLGKMPMPSYPHQVVSMDIVGPFQRSKFSHRYLFTLIDHMTGWADAFPIAHKSGNIIADTLIKSYFPQYGYPELIISDNGKEFINSDVQNLLQHLDIKHHRTTVYHPQSNGKIERFHRSLKNILRKLMHANSTQWEYELPAALTAYRNTIHTSTGHSPFQALYGRTSRLPRQTAPQHTADSQPDRLQTLYNTWRTARQHIQLNRTNNEKYIAKQPDAGELQVGDNVIVLKPGIPSTFTPRWSTQWTIIKQRHPTYWLRHNITSQEKILHREKLRLIPPDMIWNTHRQEDDAISEASETSSEKAQTAGPQGNSQENDPAIIPTILQSNNKPPTPNHSTCTQNDNPPPMDTTPTPAASNQNDTPSPMDSTPIPHNPALKLTLSRKRTGPVLRGQRPWRVVHPKKRRFDASSCWRHYSPQHVASHVLHSLLPLIQWATKAHLG